MQPQSLDPSGVLAGGPRTHVGHVRSVGTVWFQVSVRMTTKEQIERYERLRQLLEYAVHELPAGVLYGSDGANATQCAEWMNDLNEFEALCSELERDHKTFVEDCRWHFEHYPHYLGRRRHFVDYTTYVEDRGGPLRVRRS